MNEMGTGGTRRDLAIIFDLGQFAEARRVQWRQRRLRVAGQRLLCGGGRRSRYEVAIKFLVRHITDDESHNLYANAIEFEGRHIFKWQKVRVGAVPVTTPTQ